MEKNIVEDKVVISCGFDDFNSSENDTFDSVFERRSLSFYGFPLFFFGVFENIFDLTLHSIAFSFH